MPGLTRSTITSRPVMASISRSRYGRGPTRLISPRSTFEQLGQLVQAVLAQQPADARDSRIDAELVELLVLRAQGGIARQHLGQPPFSVAMHGAELERVEANAVLAQPLLHVEDGAARVELDRERDQAKTGAINSRPKLVSDRSSRRLVMRGQ